MKYINFVDGFAGAIIGVLLTLGSVAAYTIYTAPNHNLNSTTCARLLNYTRTANDTTLILLAREDCYER